MKLCFLFVFQTSSYVPILVLQEVHSLGPAKKKYKPAERQKNISPPATRPLSDFPECGSVEAGGGEQRKSCRWKILGRKLTRGRSRKDLESQGIHLVSLKRLELIRDIFPGCLCEVNIIFGHHRTEGDREASVNQNEDQLISGKVLLALYTAV